MAISLSSWLAAATAVAVALAQGNNGQGLTNGEGATNGQGNGIAALAEAAQPYVDPMVALIREEGQKLIEKGWIISPWPWLRSESRCEFVLRMAWHDWRKAYEQRCAFYGDLVFPSRDWRYEGLPPHDPDWPTCDSAADFQTCGCYEERLRAFHGFNVTPTDINPHSQWGSTLIVFQDLCHVARAGEHTFVLGMDR